MKQIRNIICLLAGFCTLFLTGCVREDMPGSEDKVMLLQMNVGSRTLTKAAAQNSEDALHTIRAYAFLGNKLMGHKYVELDGTENTSHFLMDIKMMSFTSQTIDLFVIANEASMKSPGKEQSLTENIARNVLESYSFTEAVTNVATEGMPMGYKGSFIIDDMSASDVVTEAEYPDEKEHWGHEVLRQKLDVELVRPVTKVRFFAAKKEGVQEDLYITGVRRLAVGGRDLNYLFPQDDAALKAVAHGKPDRDYDLEGGAESVKVEAVLADVTTDTLKYQAITPAYYPFESPWGSDIWDTMGDERGRVYEISYTIGGLTKVGLVYMPVAVRNTYYTVNCLIGNDGGMTILYTVAPWNNTEVWSLDYDYPTYTSFYPESHSGGELTEVAERSVINVNGIREFVVKFSITDPATGTWGMLTDIENNGKGLDFNDFEIKVFRGNVEQAGPLFNPHSDPYYIHVKLKDDFDTAKVGAAIKLGIAYTAGWANDQNVHLLINGNDQKRLWPEATGGSEARWLQIQIVQE